MRSKVLLSMVVGAASLLGSAAVQAQGAPPELPPPGSAPPEVAPPAPAATAAAGGPKMLIGADLVVALPLGDFGDAFGLGLGLLPRFEYNLMPKLNLTARLGFVYHLEKNSIKFYEIPVFVGAKYDLTDALYAAVEVGAVRGTVSIPTFPSSSETKAAATIGAGYRVGDLDLRLGLHITNLGEAGKSMELVANAGYNFWRG